MKNDLLIGETGTRDAEITPFKGKSGSFSERRKAHGFKSLGNNKVYDRKSILALISKYVTYG